MRFSVKKRLLSFSFAWKGIRYHFTTQHNAWIQLSVALLVIVTGFFLHVSSAEWCILLLCTGLVLSMEVVNTAIETLSDTLHPGISSGIEKVKDVSAAAVLIISIVAVITGLIIFVPRLLTVLGC